MGAYKLSKKIGVFESTQIFAAEYFIILQLMGLFNCRNHPIRYIYFFNKAVCING